MITFDFANNVCRTVVPATDESKLFDVLKFRPSFDEFGDDELREFCETCVEYGLNVENFDDYYIGDFSEHWHPEREFARAFYTDIIPIQAEEIMSSLLYFVDWQEVWDKEMRFGFFSISDHFFHAF